MSVIIKVFYTGVIIDMDEKEIIKRLINNDALFNNIHIIKQRFDIIPNDKDHIGAFIEFQDLQDLRNNFLNDLLDTIVDWVYSEEKTADLVSRYKKAGKTESAAHAAVIRKAKEKFRKTDDVGKLLAQGQFGELLLFHFIQRIMQAVPLLRKMKITTSSHHERFGADAIHYKVEDGKNIIILGEAKTYTSKHSFKKAFEQSITSILDTYQKHRKEINLYVHEDFLDELLNQVAEEYLSNRLKNVEIHLVCIVTYNEDTVINYSSQEEIQNQIIRVIEDKYRSFDNNKIDLKLNPILKRITYILFPVWELERLISDFQARL